MLLISEHAYSTLQVLHRQLTEEQLVAAGIDPGMIRFSVGLENVDDIIEDIKKGFDAVRNG